MYIVFLACNKNPKLFSQDPSYIYRCKNLGCVLQRNGHEVEFIHLKQLSLFSRPSLVVFHRPRMTMKLRLLVLWLKFRGITVLAEFDDLVFDPVYAEFSPGVLNHILSLKKTRKNYMKQYQALKLFDFFSLSTESLSKHLMNIYPTKKTVVLPNSVHRTWREDSDNSMVQDVNWHNPIITYLPGTRSHDRDFRVFAGGITRFLNDHPHVRLQVTGPLEFDLAVPAGQVIHREKVPFAEYHEHIRHGWVNLAPLEDTPFTRCKSALKVIEAGYWGRPTLCSPIPDTERFTGAGAVPVTSDDELYNELTKFLNPEHYYTYVEGLRERVLKQANIDQVARDFSDFVLSGKN